MIRDDATDRTDVMFQPCGDSGRVGGSATPFSRDVHDPGTVDFSRIGLVALADDDQARLPQSGDEVFGFRLLRELGRGSFARVYLAEQINLADRPVVVKVSEILGNEPQTLARLRHSNIVPIHSVHENTTAGLRAVCMPALGGASLSHVLQVMRAACPRPTRGEQFVAALATGGESLPYGERAIIDRLAGMDYLQAAAWVAARIADGLQHAHDRGILHVDIKPSNVLVAADGQPMLLDFNLSRQRVSTATSASIGGTVAYMSPEHLRAVGGRTPALVNAVDHRSDIYSLGMVFYEMLMGCRPFDASGSYSPRLTVVQAMAEERSAHAPSVRGAGSTIPWSIESIIRRCLAPAPSDRYQSAAELAADLDCFLSDRPLRHAPELSRREQFQKWVRRHPRLTSAASVGTVAIALIAGLAATLVAVNRHLDHTRINLQTAQDADRRRQFAEGTLRAQSLVATTIEHRDSLRQGLDVCRETLGLYGVLADDHWQQSPAWTRLADADRERLGDDVRELLVLTAWARVRLAPGDRATLTDALQLLDRATAIELLAPSPALLTDRSAYLDLLGDTSAAEAARDEAGRLRPTSARDNYLLATALIRNGGEQGHRRAIEPLDAAIRLNPRHYWSLIQRGICQQEVGRPALAVGDFSVCIGLWPEFALAHFNRGVALERLGHVAEAIDNYSAALRCDAEFWTAARNRGMLLLELYRPAEALADFELLVNRGQTDPAIVLGRGAALERLGRTAEADAAFADALARLTTVPAKEADRLRWVYGFAIFERAPDRARQAFDAVLKRDANNVHALYGRGMLAMGADEPAALSDFSRAVELSPQFNKARRFRAILLARQEHFEEAQREIQRCLDSNRNDGATLYAAACVAARAAAADDSNRQRDLAITHLRAAFALGYGQAQFATDPDLAGIRSRPEFAAMLNAKNDRDDPNTSQR